MKSEHLPSQSAQSQLYALLTCKAETKKLIGSVGSLLEECMPSASVWIFKTDDSEDTVESVYISGATEAAVPRLEHLRDCVKTIHHDTRISDISSHQSCEAIRTLFPGQDFTSVAIHRIRPRNNHAWGYIFALFRFADQPRQQAEEALLQADLWVQFAATILERRLLEERLQLVQTRLDLAMKASGLGIFDWDICADDLFWTPEMYYIHDTQPDSFNLSYQGWTNQRSVTSEAATTSELAPVRSGGSSPSERSFTTTKGVQCAS